MTIAGKPQRRPCYYFAHFSMLRSKKTLSKTHDARKMHVLCLFYSLYFFYIYGTIDTVNTTDTRQYLRTKTERRRQYEKQINKEKTALIQALRKQKFYASLVNKGKELI